MRSSAERIALRLNEAGRGIQNFPAVIRAADRAYVDARYSAQYTITDEELLWLVERIKMLRELVRQTCEERLAG